MMIAAIGDTGYNIALLVHIVAAFTAFAPAFVHPVLSGQLSGDGTVRARVVEHMVKNGRMIYAPALIVAGLAGFGVAGFSDQVYKMSQGWLVAAFIIWIAMNGILHAVLIPGERAIGNGDAAAEGRVNAAGGLMAVLLLAMLVIMIWKPGV
jgi:uncharacterized membrane protein